jgi:hypothetical protein
MTAYISHELLRNKNLKIEAQATGIVAKKES